MTKAQRDFGCNWAKRLKTVISIMKKQLGNIAKDFQVVTPVLKIKKNSRKPNSNYPR
ncbi:MAG: hypothetical protein VX432_07555 [Candidatus Poribacteria bacterium]|nr:hypothetical protein [Candidatus Poribacteria bacterium]